jgi:hypothetical protein
MSPMGLPPASATAIRNEASISERRVPILLQRRPRRRADSEYATELMTDSTKPGLRPPDSRLEGLDAPLTKMAPELLSLVLFYYLWAAVARGYVLPVVGSVFQGVGMRRPLGVRVPW